MKTGFPQWTKHIHLWTSYSPTHCCAEFKVILEAGMAYTEQYTRKSQIRSRDEMVNFGWQSKVCNHEIKLKPLWKNHTDDDSLVEAHPFWALKPLKKSPSPSPHANNKMHLFNIFVWVSTHQPISNWSFTLRNTVTQISYFRSFSRSTLRHIEMLEIDSGSHLGNNGESRNSFTFHLAFATWDRRVDKAIICS